VDILAHPTDPTMTAWFTTARGDDLDDTLERAAHQALTEFYERHMLVLGDTAIALLPIQNEGNTVWNECIATVGDPPCGLGAYRTLRSVREFPTSGGHSDGRSPVPPSGGVHRSSEGQELRHQGHSEGQPRAYVEERPPGDAHQGAE
jgi:hypothetical protein